MKLPVGVILHAVLIFAQIVIPDIPVSPAWHKFLASAAAGLNAVIGIIQQYSPIPEKKA